MPPPKELYVQGSSNYEELGKNQPSVLSLSPYLKFFLCPFRPLKSMQEGPQHALVS